MSAKSADTPLTTTESSLDPADWEAFRSLAHSAVDDLTDYLQSVADRPVWKALPDASKALFEEALPREGEGAAKVYKQIREHILPYPTGNIHPRFWSWVGGTGTPNQLIADMVISTMNSCSLGFDEAASSHVEVQVINWLKDLLSYPSTASGLLVSGGSMANLVGLAVARNAKAGYDVRATGIDLQQQPRLIYYASSEAHSSIAKAIELLGMGKESLHTIPVLADYTIDLGALKRAIQQDKDAGNQPACIIGNAGTVNTGANDPLQKLADIAKEENLWLHVDGAFGAFVRLSPEFAPMANGLERADSVAFDLHKWMYVQYNCGGVLVRDENLHRNTFSSLPTYLRKLERGLAAGPLNFSELGVQLSRSFVALRAWMALKSEGADRYAQQISQNVLQARYLDSLIAQHSELQLLAPTAMNIVNFRYCDARFDDAQMNLLNEEILVRLHEDGIAAPSSTVLQDRFSIRVAICNHRSTRSDFDALVNGVLQLGRELSRSD
ncbi:MAG: aminotransferase class I/II-fold pyridoxal phosphate-dependent enzyme [Woeseia sp.]